jgi:hypothetical protein
MEKFNLLLAAQWIKIVTQSKNITPDAQIIPFKKSA